MEPERTYTAFGGDRVIAAGGLRDTLLALKNQLDAGFAERVLIFEDDTGRQIDFDLRGDAAEVLDRVAPIPPKPGPGRPKLGVLSREVSLLPRHWDWLEQQPNGISAALRRLVEEASKRDPQGERVRRAIEAASTFMTTMAGNLPSFEEASRALFAKDQARLEALSQGWPADIRAHLARLLAPVFGA